MPTSETRLDRARRRRGRHRWALASGAAALCLASCTGAASPVQTMAASPIARPSPSPEPSPTPPPPGPVQGVVMATAVDASERHRLGFDNHPRPDQAVADLVAVDIASRVDQHLTALHSDSDAFGRLGAVWVTEDEGTTASLTSALATPENPIETATYDVAVQFEDGPTLAVLAAHLVRRDGTAVAVDLVFDVVGEQPLLQVFGAGREPPTDEGAGAEGDQ